MFKLLIVEDEEMIRKGLRYTFNWSKSDVVVVDEACNGKEGLDKIRDFKPDIVLLDINMPIMDGLTMIKNSITEFKYSAIIISGYDEFALAKEAIHLGVTEYLLKPLDSEQLFDALERAKKQVLLLKEHNIIENTTSTIDELDVIQKNVLKKISNSSYYVSKMIDYVNSEYSKKITIQDLVDNLGVSSTYLNQKFKKETSYTFNDYLNRYRISQSINLIKTGEGKIYTIATDVGFKDYRYFINVFKKYTNCLPSDFLEYFKNN
ncbi:response regulator [Clostridium carnis]